MAIWTVSVSPLAARQLSRLDRTVSRRIQEFMHDRLAGANEPREHGRALQGQYSGLWRYRVGDYRLICQLHNTQCVILILTVGHRSEAYKKS